MSSTSEWEASEQETQERASALVQKGLLLMLGNDVCRPSAAEFSLAQGRSASHAI